MDAIQLIKNDHRKVEQLFAEYEGLGARAKKSKARCVAAIIQELKAHTRLEETYFYPAYRQRAEEEDIVLEAYEEHDVVKHVISELEAIDPDHERYDARVCVLKDLVDHHVKEEEKQLLPQAKRLLGADRLKELGRQMAEAKASQAPEEKVRISLMRELPVEERSER